MPNLLSHLKFGMISYPAYLLVYIIICTSLRRNFSPSTVELAMSYLFYIIGSDLPDLDSTNAPLRTFTKALSLGFSIYIFTPYLAEKIKLIQQITIPKVLVIPIALSISMLIGAGLINLFLSMPIFSHRGFAHSITFAGIYGFIIYLFSTNTNDPVFLGISAFAGVMSHMIADYWKNPVKIFKFY
ncbi:MAG: metal-dependent hydrolase [Fervidobacterium sp.]|nr:metal-dependent hydrolase [Fervidobacterium sp.]